MILAQQGKTVASSPAGRISPIRAAIRRAGRERRVGPGGSARVPGPMARTRPGQLPRKRNAVGRCRRRPSKGVDPLAVLGVVDRPQWDEITGHHAGFFERLATGGLLQRFAFVRQAFRNAPRFVTVVIARRMHQEHGPLASVATVEQRAGGVDLGFGFSRHAESSLLRNKNTRRRYGGCCWELESGIPTSHAPLVGSSGATAAVCGASKSSVSSRVSPAFNEMTLCCSSSFPSRSTVARTT